MHEIFFLSDILFTSCYFTYTDKYKALANCNSEQLFICLLSNEDKEILIEISACIENRMTAMAEMLQNI